MSTYRPPDLEKNRVSFGRVCENSRTHKRLNPNHDRMRPSQRGLIVESELRCDGCGWG
jgi:hypothetical protein